MARWAEFVAVQGSTRDEALRTRTHWWTAFKAMRTGYWVDRRGDVTMAEAHVRSSRR